MTNDSRRDRLLTTGFLFSRTHLTVVPSQYWTTSGRGGQAELLWVQVSKSNYFINEIPPIKVNIPVNVIKLLLS